MKDLFLDLLGLANQKGNITEADFYAGGKFATIEFECADGTYKFSITKKDEEKKDV